MRKKKHERCKLDKRLLSCLLVIVLMLSVSMNVVAKRKTSGKYQHINWKYNTKTRTLTLSGDEGFVSLPLGEEEDICPWQKWGNKIENLVIEEGVGWVDNIQGETEKASMKCNNIKNISLPKSLKDIGYDVFRDTKITKIKLPSRLERIGGGAFSGTQLKKIVLPERTTDIGVGVFRNCTKLAKVRLPKKLDKIPKELFYNCSSLKKLTIPSKVTRIKTGAFSKSGLTNITIPKGVKEMEDACFDGCASLKKVNFRTRQLIEIKPFTFRSCAKLNTISLPDNVVYIAEEAFKDCGLQSVTLSKNLGTIGTQAFAGCTKLKEVVFPGGKVKLIGKDAFLNVPGDCVFKVPAGQAEKVKSLLIASGAGESVIVTEY